MRFFISFILVVVICVPLWAQSDMSFAFQPPRNTFFRLSTTSYAGDTEDVSRFTVHVKIPNNEIQFLKVGDNQYQAEIEFTIMIYTEKEELIENKSFRRSVTLSDFEQTISDSKYFYFHESLDLPPGKYYYVCQIVDRDSKKSDTTKGKFELENFFKKKLNVSDILILENQDIDSAAIEQIKTDFSDLLKESGDYIIAVFEIYSKNKTEQFNVEYNLVDLNGSTMQNGKFKLLKADFRTKLYIPVLLNNIGFGDHKIKMKIRDKKDKIEKSFAVQHRLTNIPLTITNIDDAIRQMLYIAKRSEIKKIQKAPKGQRQTLFNDYWEKLDPTPGTKKNELMEEYYRRVSFTNAYFSGMRPGWKTDLGMVYIRYGPPNEVTREPYNVSTFNNYSSRQIYAAQAWFYYEYNTVLYFVDENGFGDYRLANPEDLQYFR